MSKIIRLRNVPDPLHRQLKASAALTGLPLSDYLIRELPMPSPPEGCTFRPICAHEGRNPIDGGQSPRENYLPCLDAFLRRAARHVLVDLPEGALTVPEQFPHYVLIGARLKHMGGKGMAQGLRR